MDKKGCSRGNEQTQKLEENGKLLPIKHYSGVCVLGEKIVGVFTIFVGGEGAWFFTKSSITLSFYRPLFTRCKVTCGSIWS